jgi:hypothetical protein
MGLAATSAWATNLITDPGFESQTVAPNPDPTNAPGWSTFNGAAFSNSAAPAHTGSWVMSMPAGKGGFTVPGAFESFAASPGQTYTLSGWVYTPSTLTPLENDFAILQLAYFTGSALNATPNSGSGANGTTGVNIGDPNPATPTDVAILPGTWTFASVTGTTPAGTNSLGAFLLNINGDANATFDFDDISLTLAPEPASIGLFAIGGLAALRRRR